MLLVASGLHVTGEVLSLRHKPRRSSWSRWPVAVADSAEPALRPLKPGARTAHRCSMRVDPNVRSVALYDAGGQLFTSVEFAGAQR